MACVKKFTSLTPKKDMNCSQILALFLLFLLGSLASQLALMVTVISWQNGGTVGSTKETAEDRAIDTFKFLL